MPYSPAASHSASTEYMKSTNSLSTRTELPQPTGTKSIARRFSPSTNDSCCPNVGESGRASTITHCTSPRTTYTHLFHRATWIPRRTPRWEREWFHCACWIDWPSWPFTSTARRSTSWKKPRGSSNTGRSTRSRPGSVVGLTYALTVSVIRLTAAPLGSSRLGRAGVAGYPPPAWAVQDHGGLPVVGWFIELRRAPLFYLATGMPFNQAAK